MKLAWLSVAALAVIAGLSSCSSDSKSGPAQGTERGACYGNMTCNAGLSCLSNVCVNASGAGASNGGGGGAAGAAGDANDDPPGEAGSDSQAGASGAGTSVPPTKAALRVSWTLRDGATGDALSCEEAGGKVGVIATPAANAAELVEVSFPCADDAGDIELPFGTYSVDVSLRSTGLGLVKGSAPLLQSLQLADSPCDAVEADRCVVERAVVIIVDH